MAQQLKVLEQRARFTIYEVARKTNKRIPMATVEKISEPIVAGTRPYEFKRP